MSQTPASALSLLEALPPDPLLGLLAAFRADERAGKVDLGVGVFKTANGTTPVLRSVAAAEAKILDAQTTKVYEGPQGNLDFGAAIFDLVYTGAAARIGQDRVTAFAAPGGCGALGLAVAFAKRLEVKRIWVSDPCWPNHPHICNSAGAPAANYTYRGDGEGGVDLATMLDGLNDAVAGDVILVQGPCHNPTGVDLTAAQWSELADFCTARGLLPLIDIAYHGFAAGLGEDLLGVQAFLAKVPAALTSYSCSKNFGLYRERAGCLLVQGETLEEADVARTHIASIARAAYSMPPAHGAAIVATILTDGALRADWEVEVDEMRARLKHLRGLFAAAFEAEGYGTIARSLLQQNGMFSILPIATGAAATLKDKHAIYMPGSGRVNIAGLVEPLINETAAHIGRYLQ